MKYPECAGRVIASKQSKEDNGRKRSARWYFPAWHMRPNCLRIETVWRSSHDCLIYLCEQFKDNTHGYSNWIADHLNDEGWAFKDRWNNSHSFKSDDVRLVTPIGG
jgi:hypothetical protein